VFDKNNLLQCDISCINLNFGAFWGGEWQSTWWVNTQDATISGRVEINTHYFEAGNVQVNFKKDFESKPIYGGEASPEKIAKFIENAETEY